MGMIFEPSTKKLYVLQGEKAVYRCGVKADYYCELSKSLLCSRCMRKGCRRSSDHTDYSISEVVHTLHSYAEVEIQTKETMEVRT